MAIWMTLDSIFHALNEVSLPYAGCKAGSAVNAVYNT